MRLLLFHLFTYTVNEMGLLLFYLFIYTVNEMVVILPFYLHCKLDGCCFTFLPTL